MQNRASFSRTGDFVNTGLLVLLDKRVRAVAFRLLHDRGLLVLLVVRTMLAAFPQLAVAALRVLLVLRITAMAFSQLARPVPRVSLVLCKGHLSVCVSGTPSAGDKRAIRYRNIPLRVSRSVCA